MAFGPEGRRVVVSLKAVDGAYPLYGAVGLEPSLDFAQRARRRRRRGRPGRVEPSGRRHRRADPDRRGDLHRARRDRTRAGPARRLRDDRAARHDRHGRSGAYPGHPAGSARPLRLPLRAARRQRRRGAGRRASAQPSRCPLAGAQHARRAAAGRPVHRSPRQLSDHGRADHAADRRHRGRARDPEFPCRQDRDHRHVEVPWRAQPPDLPHVSAPGAGAGRDRHRGRAGDRYISPPGCSPRWLRGCRRSG